MQFFRDNNLLNASEKRLHTFITCLFIFFAVTALASAGGGGGGSSGGSNDDSGVFGMIIYLLLSIPFPYNLIAIGILILLGWLTRKKVRSISPLNYVQKFDSVNTAQSNVPADFYQRNPSFSQEAFMRKVNTAFVEIQNAWMNKDLSKVRKWISDGVWQRFNVQFAMMNVLGQRNTMSDIKILGARIDNVDRDGNYDIVDVAIHFTMMDNFVTDKYPQLNQEGFLENLEYWTFIRRSGAAEKDMYHSDNCPNCGSPLPKNMGEVSKCESCGTITTLGDYDWVLSEITQSADYTNENKKLEKNGALTNRIRESLKYDQDFSVQLIEDKASNAYMQIMAALVLKKPEAMRRFTGNELFEELSQKITADPPYIFNRLYLNNVTLVDYYSAEGRDNMVIGFKRTSQKIGFANNQFFLSEGAPYTTSEFMVMSRDMGAGNAKGSLLAHSCPNCGGPVKDTLDLKCQYCGAELNSTKTEWIITKLMGASDYSVFVHDKQIPLVTHAGVQEMDPLFKVRDYAFNNVMMIISSDGKLDANEIAFMNALARKLGYSNDKIAGMYDLAKSRQLTLRIPEKKKQAEKVLGIMQKAAVADGHIAPEEQAILDDVRQRIDAMVA